MCRSGAYPPSFPIGGSDKTQLLATAPMLDYLRIKSGDTIVHSILSSQSPRRAGGSGRLLLWEGPYSGAAEDCEEEGATPSPST